MAWNGIVDGSWDSADFTKPPFTNDVAELTHEEVLFVQETAAQFVEGHENDDFYVTSQYNVFVEWEKPINQNTYAVIKTYNPEVDFLGIDENGIIKPEIPEEPAVEESTPNEEPIIGEETPVEEVPTEEIPNEEL